MSEVFVQNNQYGTYVSNQLMYAEKINGIMYNAVSSGTFNFFLPVSFAQTPQGARLECNVPNQFVRFEDYFRVPITKKFFIDAALDIAEIIKFCKVNRINETNIELQKNCIFIDPYLNKFKLIYWPVDNNQRSSSPEAFLSQLPSIIQTVTNEDTSYLQEYADFFNSGVPFDVDNFELVLNNLKNQNNKVQTVVQQEQNGGGINDFDNQVISTENNHLEEIPEQNEVPAQSEIPVQEEVFEQEKNQPVIQSEQVVYEQPNLYVFCTSCGTKNSNDSMFCVNCGTKLEHIDAEENVSNDNAIEDIIPDNNISENNVSDNFVSEVNIAEDIPVEKESYSEPIYEETIVENPITDSPVSENFIDQTDETEQVDTSDSVEKEPEVYPMLTRVSSNDKYIIVKPVYSIGKKKEMCDLFIDNTYVSRHHADIIRQDDNFYIMDKGSLNKTYVDDTMIDPETPVEIFNGTKITIANEDFIFSLESLD